MNVTTLAVVEAASNARGGLRPRDELMVHECF